MPRASTSPQLAYTINFTTTGVYTVLLRGYASDAAGDSIYVATDDQPTAPLTGFIPQQWSWAGHNIQNNRVTIEITTPGIHKLRLWQREDGLRLDRILLTADINDIPSGSGP